MRPFRTFIALCVVLGAPASFAQPRPDPADPAVQVPAAEYRSSFAGYRPLGEEAVGDWRAANDEVRRIGGWREYAREAQGAADKPGAGAPKPAAGAPKPAPGGHSGHGHHTAPAGQK